MSWQITQDGSANVVVLDSEMGIQDAANFHRAVLPLASGERAVRLDASAARSIHTSIMQILYALSQAAPDFRVTKASKDFQAVEARAGLSLARSNETGALIRQSTPE
jgi:anti-anti-sigma regulatory factor